MTPLEKLRSTGIIPVIKINRPEHAVGMAQALVQAGLPAAEVTFRTEAAAESIRLIAQQVPDIFVCAGTVLTPEQAKLAVDSGAQAVISPGTNMRVVSWCLDHQIPVYPGCATPSEVEQAMSLGLKTVKLFPAEVVGGVAMLKALAGPYGNMLFMPTGGIRPENVLEYLRLKNVVACGGTWICPEDLVDSGKYEEIYKIAKEAAQLVLSLRQDN
jgi:2-dehydro-3-deoxyphosphogluconate aldolase/(4S)-4-hydroxy-2-oxoglutarate aldolase